MPVTTTAPCPVDGCDGIVDVEVTFKVKTQPGYKPGVTAIITADGVTLIGDHMRDHHPDLEIPAALRG